MGRGRKKDARTRAIFTVTFRENISLSLSLSLFSLEPSLDGIEYRRNFRGLRRRWCFLRRARDKARFKGGGRQAGGALD